MQKFLKAKSSSECEITQSPERPDPLRRALGLLKTYLMPTFVYKQPLFFHLFVIWTQNRFFMILKWQHKL